MTLEMYTNPVKMVDDVSALGLRHVGYAIPTPLFGPFVSACVDLIATLTTDAVVIEVIVLPTSLVGVIMSLARCGRISRLSACA